MFLSKKETACARSVSVSLHVFCHYTSNTTAEAMVSTPHVQWLGVALVTCRSQTAEGQRVALVGSQRRY